MFSLLYDRRVDPVRVGISHLRISEFHGSTARGVRSIVCLLQGSTLGLASSKSFKQMLLPPVSIVL